MKRVLLGSALALVLAAPAFASPLVGSDSHDTNASASAASGSHASSASLSGASAANRTSVRNTTQSLNQQELDNRNVAAQGQGQSADNNGNSYTSDDDNKTEVYAISYTDAAPPTTSAVIGDGVVVTTWGVKVLGPIFGMTDQHVHYLPSAIREIAEIDFMTQHNDGTYEGELVQLSYIHTVCAYMPELAVERKLACK